MFIKKKLKYFTRPKQISPDLSGVSGDFRIVWYPPLILLSAPLSNIGYVRYNWYNWYKIVM